MAETTEATLVWREGLRFSGTARSGLEVTMESPSSPAPLGPSPMELFVMGIGGCTAIDTVAILRKMRQPLEALRVDVVAHRAPEHPKYVTAVELVFRVGGAGVDREKVERAVELSRSTYCSAVASLRPDCPLTWRIEMPDQG